MAQIFASLVLAWKTAKEGSRSNTEPQLTEFISSLKQNWSQLNKNLVT
jgi:hypothetical protein